MVLGSRRRTGRDARQATEPRPAARTAEPPRCLAPIAPASGQGRHRACARQPPRRTTTAATRTGPETGTRTQPEETRTKTVGARGTSRELEEVQAHAETRPRGDPDWPQPRSHATNAANTASGTGPAGTGDTADAANANPAANEREEATAGRREAAPQGAGGAHVSQPKWLSAQAARNATAHPLLRPIGATTYCGQGCT